MWYTELAMRHFLQQIIYCLLTRYIDTMGRGDAPVPVAGAILPPSASAEEDEVVEICVCTVNGCQLTHEIGENMEKEVIFSNRLPLNNIYT